MSFSDALSPGSKRAVKLPVPSIIPKAVGFAVWLPLRCLELIPELGKKGAGAALKCNVIPVALTAYAALRILKKLRRKTPSPITEEMDKDVMEMVQGLDSKTAAAQLETVRLNMLQGMIDGLLKEMLEDTLSSTLSLPFTEDNIEVVRQEMQERILTLELLYGADVIDLVLKKLEKQKSWTKDISDQVNATDINNPRLNYPLPKSLEDPQQWLEHLRLQGQK